MHFLVKSTLQSNYNHTPKHPETQLKKHIKTATQNLCFKPNFLVGLTA